MVEKHLYTANEIDEMRALVLKVAQYHIKRQGEQSVDATEAKWYRLELGERMLQTYVLAGVTYHDLAHTYSGLVDKSPL